MRYLISSAMLLLLTLAAVGCGGKRTPGGGAGMSGGAGATGSPEPSAGTGALAGQSAATGAPEDDPLCAFEADDSENVLGWAGRDLGTVDCPAALLEPHATWERELQADTPIDELEFFSALDCETQRDEVKLQRDIHCRRTGQLRCSLNGVAYDIDYSISLGNLIVIDGHFGIKGEDGCEVKVSFTLQH